jgi:hypothetical protein
MPDIVFDAEIEKVETFASKGGGLRIKLGTSPDPQTAAAILLAANRSGTIKIDLHAETEVEDDPDQLTIDMDE